MGSFRGAETHARSILKAVSWRTLGTLDTFAISWYMTGKLELAGLIAGLEFVIKSGGIIFTSAFGLRSPGVGVDYRCRRFKSNAAVNPRRAKATINSSCRCTLPISAVFALRYLL